MKQKNNDEYSVRKEKLDKIRKSGINVYPSAVEVNYKVSEVLKLKISSKNIKIAGRLMTVRTIGKLTFAVIKDVSGQIQIALQQDYLKEKYNFFINYIDVGDFIAVQGHLFKTHKGETTVKVESYNIIAKALRPLPEKWHGLKDQELRIRKRYLDLIVNQQTRDIFLKRSEFIKNIRNYLDKNGFIEVETPILENIPGGAEAEPFITHHNTLDIDLYLRISLELHLKRLVVGGFEKVFELGRTFRNEGMSAEHLQEFTMLEFYWAYSDYRKLKKFVEDFYISIIKKTFGKLKFDFQGQVIDFEKPWKQIDYAEAIKKETGIDVASCGDAEIKNAIKKFKVGADLGFGRGRLIDQLYKKVVRQNLIQPTFVLNHPVSVSPLAKRHHDNSEITERLVVVIAGSEMGNGFSELNDPIDQRKRFEEQMILRQQGDKEAQMMDEDYIIALEHGMPPTAGFGAGIDRLLMVLTGQQSIREVVLFPVTRPE